jgi:hypothetical protein
MQRYITIKNQEAKLEIKNLNIDDEKKLVEVFAWLIQEDKKQNPEIYKNKKLKND